MLSLLLPHVAAIAPDVRLRLSPMDAGLFGDLHAGRVDLGIGSSRERGAGIRSQTVFVDRYAFAMRAGHPALQERPTPALFRREHYVLVTSLIGTADDASTLFSSNVAPAQITMRVPTYAVLPAILTPDRPDRTRAEHGRTRDVPRK